MKRNLKSKNRLNQIKLKWSEGGKAEARGEAKGQRSPPSRSFNQMNRNRKERRRSVSRGWRRMGGKRIIARSNKWKAQREMRKIFTNSGIDDLSEEAFSQKTAQKKRGNPTSWLEGVEPLLASPALSSGPRWAPEGSGGLPRPFPQLWSIALPDSPPPPPPFPSLPPLSLPASSLLRFHIICPWAPFFQLRLGLCLGCLHFVTTINEPTRWEVGLPERYQHFESIPR